MAQTQTERTALQAIETELQARAVRDHAAHVGKILLVSCVTGYNESDNSVEVHCDPPARMRVDRSVNQDLDHWVDNWLDPYWDVSLVEEHPALKGIRSMWTFGPSYCTDGRTEGCSDWVLEETTIMQKVKDALRGTIKQ